MTAPREVHRAFRDFLGERPICAHNLSYDLDRCLLPEWSRLRAGTAHVRGFCTVKLARRTLPELKFHGMGLLTRKYQLTRAKAHAALADAQATAQLVSQVLAPRLRGTAFEDFAALVLSFAEVAEEGVADRPLHDAIGMVAAAAAGAVLVLALGLASRMGDFAIGLPLALATAWLSHRRSLPVPAVIGIGAAVGFFAVR